MGDRAAAVHSVRQARVHSSARVEVDLVVGVTRIVSALVAADGACEGGGGALELVQTDCIRDWHERRAVKARGKAWRGVGSVKWGVGWGMVW